MTIYFAGSISGGRGDQAVYQQIIDLLKQHGTVLTEHFGDATLTAAGEALDDCVIHDRDLAWLRRADVLVAEVTTPSLGVGYEIGRAVEWGKRIVCLYRPSARATAVRHDRRLRRRRRARVLRRRAIASIAGRGVRYFLTAAFFTESTTSFPAS